MASEIDIVPAGSVGADGMAAADYAPSRRYDTPETNAEAETEGPDRQAIFWEKQITTALMAERRWRAEAEHAEDMFFGPDEDGGQRDGATGKAQNKISDTTATIHGNIEVLKPLLFSETPVPIVQRRFRGDGKRTDATDIAATEVGQRIAQWVLGTTNFDDAMCGVRDDWLIAGRGAARALYKADFETTLSVDPVTGATVQQERKSSEVAFASHWEWRRLVMAPGRSWENMPWIGFEVPMTRSQIERRFPDKVDRIAYNRKGLIDRSRAFGDSDRLSASEIADTTTSGDAPNSPFDAATVWEIWIKDERKIIWWSPDLRGEILDSADDPLGLENFWPMPKPLLASTKGKSMNPRPDLRYYEAAAEEVEKATRKLSEIMEVIAVAGIYPGNAEQEVKKLLSGKNAVYPAQAWAALMDKGGTRELIQWLPLEAMIAAANALSAMREQAKQRMFEQSGVSDIMRAQGDPRESATAQNLKGKYAGMRLSSRQRAMAIYARDMLRLLVEIGVEMFDTEFLAEICNLDLPLTESERQAEIARQQQITAAHDQAMKAFQKMQDDRAALEQQAQAQGAQLQLPPMPAPPPPLPPFDKVPETSWELVHERLRNDLSRKITITIETQSTILSDEAEDKQARVEFLTAFSTFVREIMPLAAGGQFPMKTAKELLLFGVRAFPKSRTLETMIAELPDEMPKGDKAPDVQVQVAQIRAQVDLEIAKMKSADAEKDRQADIRLKGIDLMSEAAHKAHEPVEAPQPPQQ